MAYVPDLDIPSGLEEPYFKVVQFGGATSQDTIRLKRSSPARKNYYKLGNNSLFVLWQDLYNGLSSARHIAWTNYWGTLPFGDHTGLSEWPGSGYSAFIYVNAPRYQAGLGPLLDPPAAYPEFLYNPTFDSGLGHWDLYGWSYGTNEVIHDGADIGDYVFADDEVDLVDGATYRIKISSSSGSGIVTMFVYNKEEGLDWIIADSLVHVSPGSVDSYVDFVFDAGSWGGRLDGWTLTFLAGKWFADLSNDNHLFSGSIYDASFKRIS